MDDCDFTIARSCNIIDDRRVSIVGGKVIMILYQSAALFED